MDESSRVSRGAIGCRSKTWLKTRSLTTENLPPLTVRKHRFNLPWLITVSVLWRWLAKETTWSNMLPPPGFGSYLQMEAEAFNPMKEPQRACDSFGSQTICQHTSCYGILRIHVTCNGDKES